MWSTIFITIIFIGCDHIYSLSYSLSLCASPNLELVLTGLNTLIHELIKQLIHELIKQLTLPLLIFTHNQSTSIQRSTSTDKCTSTPRTPKCTSRTPKCISSRFDAWGMCVLHLSETAREKFLCECMPENLSMCWGLILHLHLQSLLQCFGISDWPHSVYCRKSGRKTHTSKYFSLIAIKFSEQNS